MSYGKDIELLADIARLLKKYGPEPFEKLAQRLKEGDLVENLLSILEPFAKTGRQSKTRLGMKRALVKKRNGIAELFQRIEKDDPEKANLLRQFHRDLVGKSILPTLNDIRHFAEDNGLNPIKVTGREKSILPLLRDMSAIPFDRISQMVSRLPQSVEEGERTLEAWADVILGDRHKDKAK